MSGGRLTKIYIHQLSEDTECGLEDLERLFIGTDSERESRFGLVSLFNGISTFVGYLMPKLSF